jgi:formiminotetrahydrofolate cyclodeaminase
MNKARRKLLNSILEELDELEDQLQGIIDDEQAAYDNLPESIQNGERGQRSSEAIEALEGALDSLSDVRDGIESACE